MSAPTQGPGTWFDGVNGAPQPVTVTLEDTALAIASAQGTTQWNYAAIERLPAPEHRLRLGLAKSASTARLEIRDPAFAESVKTRLDLRTIQVEASERRRRHRVVEWSIAGVIAIILIGAVGMPSLAELLLPLIPRSAETPIGEAVHAQTKASFEAHAGDKGPFECGEQGPQERAGKAAFLKMLGQLETAAELPVAVRPFIVRTEAINAVAMPGGIVHVYGGIIADAQSSHELAGVIAHELGHVAHRDGMRKLLHMAGVSFLFGVALGDVMGSGGMTTAADKILNNRHSRAEEAAADAFSTQVMTKLGADPHAMATMFERWMKGGQPSRRMLLLYDHPANADRVAAIRAAPGVANPKPPLSDQEWQALKQACSRK